MAYTVSPIQEAHAQPGTRLPTTHTHTPPPPRDQVYLNVYDVTNASSDSHNQAIIKLNSVTKEIGLGGVFHGAVELDGFEWSFGYCDEGTGVYCCHAKQNTAYTFRETLDLGTTPKTIQEVRAGVGWGGVPGMQAGLGGAAPRPYERCVWGAWVSEWEVGYLA